MSDKQSNIIEFIERNTPHRIGTCSVSHFIGQFWREAQRSYEMKRTAEDINHNLHGVSLQIIKMMTYDGGSMSGETEEEFEDGFGEDPFI